MCRHPAIFLAFVSQKDAFAGEKIRIKNFEMR
jgi:hypothetical protein